MVRMVTRMDGMDAMADSSADRVDDDGIDIEARRIDRAIGIELRRWRSHRKLTQDDLAEAAEISKRTVIRLERGERPMSVAQLYRICRALEIKPSDLLSAVEGEIGI